MSAEKLTILQVSPTDIGGGAEKVAVDLHHQYLNRGVDSWLAVGRKCSADDRVLGIPRAAGSSGWKRGLLGVADSVSGGTQPRGAAWALDRALRTIADPGHMARVQRGLEDFDFPGSADVPVVAPTHPDVLHLHNLHGGYFDVRALPALTAQLPTILTMHDVWPLTGHCAYPIGCERWRTGCGDCPDLALPIPIRRDASAENRRIKRAALGSSGLLRVATPSRWLMRMVEESGLADDLAETRVIPNGIDTEVFRPGSRREARAKLGLPTDATIVLFSARSAKASPFKGFETLYAALPLIARADAVPDLMLIALGEDAPDAMVEGVPIRFVPFADDPATVARYYQAADLYLHPARAENFPLAVLEAMGCGLAVVASNAGGIPEIVADGETGLLFAAANPRGLAEAASTLLGDAAGRTRMAHAGRSLVEAHFALPRQVGRYLDWYRELTG